MVKMGIFFPQKIARKRQIKWITCFFWGGARDDD